MTTAVCRLCGRPVEVPREGSTDEVLGNLLTKVTEHFQIEHPAVFLDLYVMGAATTSNLVLRQCQLPDWLQVRIVDQAGLIRRRLDTTAH
jgi:hypothetical protein